MNQTICAAIGSRKMLQFYYDGGTRVVEPYCHGISTAGNELLRAYQVSGFSQSENPVGWKLFEVGKISSLSILDRMFTGARPEYNPNDRVMSTIYCRV